MYRNESKPPTCLACASPHVTPETHFDPSEGDANVIFETPVRPSGFFGGLEIPREHFKVNRARICLACGHVMFFLSPRIRRQIESRMAELRAVAPSEE